MSSPLSHNLIILKYSTEYRIQWHIIQLKDHKTVNPGIQISTLKSKRNTANYTVFGNFLALFQQSDRKFVYHIGGRARERLSRGPGFNPRSGLDINFQFHTYSLVLQLRRVYLDSNYWGIYPPSPAGSAPLGCAIRGVKSGTKAWNRRQSFSNIFQN